MQVGMVGSKAALTVREEVCRKLEELFSKGKEVFPFPVVLLATCRRVELYFSGQDLDKSHREILSFLRQEVPSFFEDHFYSCFTKSCFVHLCKVTAGLDSAVTGESDIQRQVKQAYGFAASREKLLSPLHYLFQKSLKIAKAVRGKMENQSWPHLGKMVWSFSKATFTDLESRSILVVGNSAINRQILSFFSLQGAKNLHLATRTTSSFPSFCHVGGWELLEKSNDFSLIICGTKNREYVLSSSNFSKGEEKLIIDLGVPRNVEPKVGEIEGVELLNMEELEHLMEQKKDPYWKEISSLGKYIEDNVVSLIDIYERKKEHKLFLQEALSC